MRVPQRLAARHEPDETRFDAVNEALDRIVDEARAVIAAGGEVALRARLARLLGEADAHSSTPSITAAGRRAGRKSRARG